MCEKELWELELAIEAHTRVGGARECGNDMLAVALTILGSQPVFDCNSCCVLE